MKTVRTGLSTYTKDLFRTFLDSIGLQEVIIGDYLRTESPNYMSSRICYAYSENSADIVAILTYISLKYGDLSQAFDAYMIAIDSSPMYNPQFNWVP